MTRDWVFTLTLANKDYNLWNDLILATVADKTFTTSPYVPNMVSELEIQNQTPGANITRSAAGGASGFVLSSFSWDINRQSCNNIDLTKRSFRSDLEGAKLYVQIVSV